MSNTISSLPLHLSSELLLKLSAESIVRSRCVSKLWSSITTDPCFTNTFETRSSSRPNILILFRKRDKLFVFSIPHNSNSSQHVDIYHMKFPKKCDFSFTESVHGLICFRKTATNPIVWNPSTRQLLTLSKPDKTWECTHVFLGYDPIEGKHKVMCLPYGRICDEGRVFTLGSAEKKWRKIKTNHSYYTFCDSNGKCINGVIYFQVFIDEDAPNDSGTLMSFDVRSEKFSEIKLKLPWDNTDEEDQERDTFYWRKFISYEGKLACLSETILNNDYIALWILEDAKEHRWSCRSFVVPLFRYNPRLKTKWKLSGVTDAGELIYVPSMFLESFSVLYIDPKKNSLRRVEFKGVADYEFRLNHGLENKRLHGLIAIPHHIESLMRL